MFKCEECSFEDTVEENVLNHTITKHSRYTCELCDFQTKDEGTLIEHETDIHKKTKHTCNKCTLYFNSMTKLNEHKTKKHQESAFPCDYCKFKGVSIQALDKHIQSFHKINKDKNIDIRNVTGKQACNFSDPSHSNTCCDREPGQPSNFFTPKERLQNGACRKWNESVCPFADLCRYAHVVVCSFQETCRNPQNCRFYHINRNNIDFLGGRVYQNSYLKNSSQRR